jgi:3-methyl-2-oxobutanoate hydroxymethyltransferase
MQRKRPTVADVRANKGKYQYTMMRVENWEELAAAEEAGIDMVSVPPEMLVEKRFRDVAPSLFAVPGQSLYETGTSDDILRWAFQMINAGADAIYCAASFPVVRRLADEAVPVIGHVGLIPSKCTWTGGFKAVGKTADEAMKVWDMCRRYEDVGAFGVEIEVVPPEVTAAISARSSLFMVSMGGGKGGDCQYLFACDVLGTNTGHVPRHSKQYANLAREFQRIQEIRVSAFKEWAGEVRSGAWPDAPCIVNAPKAEMEAFAEQLRQAAGDKKK